MEQMKISIGADLGSAIQQVNSLTASVTALGGAANSAGGISTALAKIPPALRPIKADELTKLSTAFRQLQVDAVKLKFDALNKVPDGLKAIPAAAGQAATALAAIKPGANQATAGLIDVGRVLQDLPFGFVGIGNNINPLLESFSRLRAASGSTGGALRALGSSLLGGGGLGLAISAITAAATFASIGFDRWVPKVKEAGKATKELQDSSEGIVKSLSEEASRISVLVSAIQSDTLSKKQRNGAIQELQRLNPDYFGQLDKEKALVGQVNTAYTAYTASLLKQYSAKALGKQLDELFDKRLKLQIELDSSAATINRPELEKQRNAIQARINSLGGISILPKDLTDITKLTPVQQQVIKLQQDLARISNIRLFDLTGVSGELKEVNNQINGLLTRVSNAGNLDIKLPGGADKKENDALKEAISNLENYGKTIGFTSAQFQKLTDLRVKLVTRDQIKLGLDSEQLRKQINDIQNSNELLEQQKGILDNVAKTAGLIQSEKLQALNIDVAIAFNETDKGNLDSDQLQRTIDSIYKNAALKVPVSLAFDQTVKADILARGLKLPAIPVSILPKFDAQEKENFKDAIAGIKTTLATQDFKLEPTIAIDGTKARKAINEFGSSFGTDLKTAVESAVTGAFVGVGEAISSAIGGAKGFKDIFNSLLSDLGAGIKRIGEVMIAYGV